MFSANNPTIKKIAKSDLQVTFHQKLHQIGLKPTNISKRSLWHVG